MNQDITHQGEGLYVPQMESDSCGTGLLANLSGAKTHGLVNDALTMLRNMEHRGACGCEANACRTAGRYHPCRNLNFCVILDIDRLLNGKGNISPSLR